MSVRWVWRSQVLELIACDRSERARAATSSLSVATSPPSPTDSTLFEKKLNAPASPKVPSLRPRSVALGACAASSTSTIPRSSHSSESTSTAAGKPAKCTAVITFVRGVIRRSTSAGSMDRSRWPTMSQKTGSAPQ